MIYLWATQIQMEHEPTVVLAFTQEKSASSMTLICYDIVTRKKAGKTYSKDMRLETVQPLFSFLEGGLFIHQANTLLDDEDDLCPRREKTAGVLILGAEFGPLDNRQILHLLAAAVSRLIGNLPHIPSREDSWVHGTILGLYDGFCQSFLEKFPNEPDEQPLLLTSFLDRVVENHLGQTPGIEYSALNCERWKFLIDAGERLLELQFPVTPPGFPPKGLPANGSESDLGWLQEQAQQLRSEVDRLQDLRAAPQFSRGTRPGTAKGRRGSRRQFESVW
jgi:hypothetical protein